MTGGDPTRGRSAISRYGCSTCHTIPGVSGANGLVGPPLGQVASNQVVETIKAGDGPWGIAIRD